MTVFVLLVHHIVKIFVQTRREKDQNEVCVR